MMVMLVVVLQMKMCRESTPIAISIVSLVNVSRSRTNVARQLQPLGECLQEQLGCEWSEGPSI